MVLRSEGCRDVVGSVGSRGSSLRAGSRSVWVALAAEKNGLCMADEKKGSS